MSYEVVGDIRTFSAGITRSASVLGAERGPDAPDY